MTSFADTAFQPPPEAEAFYIEGLKLLAQSDIPFLISGTYAVTAYTGIIGPTKDLDIFCKASDYPRILSFFQEQGYDIEVEDERWIAKIYNDKYFFDIIYSCRTSEIAITDEWFENAPVVDTLQGEPLEIFPFLGNSRLAETIDRFDNVKAAVHGHAHRGVHRGATPKGVPVYNVARPVMAVFEGPPYALFEV